MPGFGLLGLLGFLIVVIIPAIVKILREYEKGVVFTLGRVGRKAAGPQSKNVFRRLELDTPLLTLALTVTSASLVGDSHHSPKPSPFGRP